MHSRQLSSHGFGLLSTPKKSFALVQLMSQVEERLDTGLQGHAAIGEESLKAGHEIGFFIILLYRKANSWNDYSNSK